MGARKTVSKTIRRLFRPRLPGIPTLYQRTRTDVAARLQRSVSYVFEGSVDGDFAEFGTRTGFSSAVIASSIAEFDHKSRRRLWLFDSFEGLPKSTSPTDLANPHVSQGTWAEGTMRGLTEGELRRHVGRWLRNGQIITHGGWYSETMSRVPDDARFSLVHADCDLYQSTVDCLSPLFRRGLLSRGAIVIFDDWNCARADNELGQRRAWRELVNTHGIDCEDIGGHSWCGRSFVVHSYSSLATAAAPDHRHDNESRMEKAG